MIYRRNGYLILSYSYVIDGTENKQAGMGSDESAIKPRNEHT
jgi:hypothetical protein